MSGQEQLIKLITDALEKSPDTATDAHALYKTLSVALAHYIICLLYTSPSPRD